MVTATGMVTGMAVDSRVRKARSVADCRRPPLTKGRRFLGLLAIVCALGSAHAANWTITPTVSANETWTDNVALVDKGKESDLVTDVSPGIRIEGRGARLRLNFDYAFHQLYYNKDSTRDETQNYLNASGALEAVEKWMFVDFSGNISQQSLSAFGKQSPSSINVNRNRTETSTYRVSPYVRGAFGTTADYELRYQATTTRADSGQASNSDTSTWSANLKGATGFANLAWSLDVTSVTYDYDVGRTSEFERLSGALTYRLTPQFRFSILFGQERSNLVTLTKEDYSNYGASVDWAPGERTRLSAAKEHRSFGDSHTVSFSYRTPLTAWSFSDVRDASAQTDQLARGGSANIGDLWAVILSPQFPNDPAGLAAAVKSSLGTTPPESLLPSGYLTTRVTVQRNRQFSVAALGARNTVTFTLNRSDDEPLGADNLGGDFATTSSIRQRGTGLNWSYRLTPLSSLAALASWQNSTGSNENTQDTTSRNFSLNYVTQLGGKTSLTLGARHANSDGSGTDYRENALTAGLTARF